VGGGEGRAAVRSLALLLMIPVVLVLLGTVGYHFIEGWSFFDSLYMTVITVTTVGYLEVHELSREGRSFTMLLALGGVFTLFYAASEILRAVVGGELRGALGRQRMERTLAEIKDHVVVCGYGRMGRLICQELSARGIPFVLVERQADRLRGFDIPHGVALAGDATSEEILLRAGLQRARGLIAVAASDADNLYVVMTARELNDSLLIVVRAEEEAAEKKLRRAGATRVVSPWVAGSHRVTQALLRPNATEFIDLATRNEHLELQIEETEVAPGSQISGRMLKDSRVRQDLGIIIVAIKKPGGEMVFNPAPEAIIEAKDVLITLGPRPQLDRLAALARPWV
jgi:voltage-gated potassium channel